MIHIILTPAFVIATTAIVIVVGIIFVTLLSKELEITRGDVELEDTWW